MASSRRASTAHITDEVLEPWERLLHFPLLLFVTAENANLSGGLLEQVCGDAVPEGAGAAGDQDCRAGNIHAKTARSLCPAPVIGNGQGLRHRGGDTNLRLMKAIALGIMAGLGLLTASAASGIEAQEAEPKGASTVPLAKRETVQLEFETVRGLAYQVYSRKGKGEWQPLGQIARGRRQTGDRVVPGR